MCKCINDEVNENYKLFVTSIYEYKMVLFNE